jgi:hypothetical protein
MRKILLVPVWLAMFVLAPVLAAAAIACAPFFLLWAWISDVAESRRQRVEVWP